MYICIYIYVNKYFHVQAMEISLRSEVCLHTLLISVPGEAIG